jgi:molybdopterin-guanine dinucleotide biosynthesis protein A
MLPEIAALVLAGGEGRRMGGGKQARLLGSRRLLDYAIASATRHGGPVAISVRDPAQAPPGVEFVIDSERAEGPLAGLVAGLAWAERSGASFLLTVPCDAPFLPGDLAVRLLDRLRQTEAMVALPLSAGRLHPSCGLWRIDALMHAAAYIATGRASLHGLAEFVGLAVEDWGAPERDPFFNVNTPEDLAIAKVWLAQPHLE